MSYFFSFILIHKQLPKETQTEFTTTIGTSTTDDTSLGNMSLTENLTEDVSNFMAEAETYLPFKIAFDINYYWSPILAPIGLLGNTLSFLVMIKPNNRKVSTYIYMAAISIIDNIMMCLALIDWLATGPRIVEWNLMMCKTITWLIGVAQQNSRYQVLAMIIDKYIAIKWPHKAATYSTPRKTNFIITGLLIFALIYDIPHIFLPNVVDGKCLGLGHFLSSNIFIKIYTWSTFDLNGVIPLFMLIYMNFVIVQTVRKSRQIFKVNTATTGAGKVPATNKVMDTRQKTMKNAEHQLTIMLVLVTTLFIILLLPIYIRIINVTFVVVTSPSEYASSILFFQITYKLLTTNNGINFFLYCISGTKFRNDLKEVLCSTRQSSGSSLEKVRSKLSSNFIVLASQNTLNLLTLKKRDQ